ncbi:thiamine transporter 1-like isoform 2-T2 [Glossina fuscipes fuscipes]
MKEWLKISCILCLFGFLREVRPSESFITEFLLGPWRNITQDEVNRQVYPVGTYSYLAQLVVVFLMTDFLRYKPLIIACGVTGCVVWSMLLWTSSLEALKVLEFFYGTYMATEVAYYTYIYAKVDKKYYPRVTSHTRAAMFLGKLVAGTSAQVLIILKVMNYRDLNYITFATQIAATLWALFLPKVKNSLYFHHHDYLDGQCSTESRNHDTIDAGDAKSQSQVNEGLMPLKATSLLWLHFYNAYTNVKVLQWSLWYAMGLCGYLQVISYIQVLWKDIKPDSSIAWNGAVDATLTALSAIFALGAGYMHTGLLKPHILVLAVLSSLKGFVVFGALYAFTITVASAEVARHLEEDSFGLVFGINTLLALIFQTIITVVVISDTGFALTVKGQYTVYAFYFIIIGVVYFLCALWNLLIVKSIRDNINLSS